MINQLQIAGLFSSLALALVLSGCLQTRKDVEESESRKVIHEQVSYLQKSAADQGSQYQEIREDLRELGGRIEVVESKQDKQHTDRDRRLVSLEQQNVELNKKIGVLTEEIGKLEGQITTIGSAMDAMRTAQTQAAKAKPNQSSFESGEEHFQNKDWANAILRFSEYREANPKGKKYAEATYKIGASFESLGKKKEAKAFFEEVIENFPKSSFSSKAKDKLKKLK